MREYQPTEQFEFQYISCYCLSSPAFSIFFPIPDFNTSHVTVYQEIQKHKGTCNVISIHLMLLFIRFIIPPPFLTGDFNTSHVTVYQEILLESQYQLSNFNTSHVTVYHRLSLSIIHFIKNFNTSHVTVYPIHFFMYRDNFKFQYISCYCLSKSLLGYGTFNRFQYISCYCLSESNHVLNCASNISIHLMLLFICLFSCHCTTPINFNTSHVTVYR